MVYAINATVNRSTPEGADHVIRGVSLDDILVGDGDRRFAVDSVASNEEWGGSIALLKITPRECCAADTTEKAVRGSQKLLSSGRVKCLALEVSFDNSTAALIETLGDLQKSGYKIAHT